MSGLGPRNGDASTLLMCGGMPWLLETRTRVLQYAGFVVDHVSCPSEVEARLASGRYGLLLICHSIEEHEVGTLRAIAGRAGVRSYWIEPLTPPETLIGDIDALLQSPSKVECGSQRNGDRSKASA